MFTMLVGVLVVAFGAVVFGYALFGPRPVPQPATSSRNGQLSAPPPVAGPSDADLEPVPPTTGVLPAGPLRRLLQREPTADHQPAADASVTPIVRVRSGLLLTLIVVGLAAVIGVIASIALVGVVLLVT
jgi:hypothetical protein